MESPFDTWFKREILVHEAALLRYLARVWPRRDEVNDLRQEIYIKIYESAGAALPAAPRSFLFATARHHVTDRFRRSRIISIESVSDLDSLNVLVDELSPERSLDAHQQLKRLSQALNSLPPKCRQIIWLRRIDQLSQQEVAQYLGLSVRTVEDQVQKGMRHLADAFFGRNVMQNAKDSTFNLESESGHGQHHTD